MPSAKILLIEDDDSDAALVMNAARREGLDAAWLRADDEPGFLAMLAEEPDAIVTDYNLPSFSALRVLELVRERGSKLPVLVVTGAMEDELAAECIRRGAADYLLKDRLARFRDALEGAVLRFRAEKQEREAERRLLEAAASRAVLNDMLLHSLSVDLSKPFLRAVIDPVFDYGALPGLAAVLVDAPGLGAFSVDRGDDGTAGRGTRSIERRFDTAVEGDAAGRVAFVFLEGAVPDRESERFLDDVVYVVSGVLRRAFAERSLRQSLSEREQLLREIHHRVRNNLAAVRSLVSLEASRADRIEEREALARVESRVCSMALVHEMLYSRDGFTGIDFEDYLRELKIHVADSGRCAQDALSLVTDCRGLRLALEAAVTLGILVSELFVHAATRAASEGGVEIRVRAEPSDAKAWRVEYRERPCSDRELDLDFVELLLPQYGGSIDLADGELLVIMFVPGDSKSPLACP
jgi:two-component sensor histidine kinase/FixJ family two-component response regulator